MSPTHGEQEMSVWNGHYACTCYHPLFVFNQFGDLERCALRPGNVHSADGWENVLRPVIVRYQGKVLRIYFRADAAFASIATDVEKVLVGPMIPAVASPVTFWFFERIEFQFANNATMASIIAESNQKTKAQIPEIATSTSAQWL